jgi:histidine ammonia-lyase
MTLTLAAPPSLTLDAFHGLLSEKGTRLALSPELRELLRRNRAFLEERMGSGEPLYGINTGFGNSSSNRVPEAALADLQRNLTRYHGCGLGGALSEPQCRAILLVRTTCLLQGKSGVSVDLAEALLGLWNAGISPCIPALGSVGASGDLTPLSYVAAVLQGERRAWVDGRVVPAAQALADAGLTPYILKPKEGLALMNGTAAMTALALLASREARVFAELVCECTAAAVEVLGGRVSPYRPALHDAKPHIGNREAAARILALLAPDESRDTTVVPLDSSPAREARLQDSYSLRCAPQVVGALFDALRFAEEILLVELNSVNDNPVVLHEERMVLNGGHFFGSHVALACDLLKPAVANAAGLLERQMAILVDARLSNGLPDNLVDIRRLGDEAPLHHGLKAVQISQSAVVAEALKNTMPASVFSRPTECLNQDVVSLGTIAARDLIAVLDLATWAGALQVFALCQAAHVTPELGFEKRLSPAGREWFVRMRSLCAPVTFDRALDGELSALRGALFARHMPATREEEVS